MSNSNSSSSGGIGFVGILTIVFIVLKLIDKIDWSWWWVLSPMWISASLVILVVVAVVLFNSRSSRRPAPKSRWLVEMEKKRNAGRNR